MGMDGLGRDFEKVVWGVSICFGCLLLLLAGAGGAIVYLLVTR